MTGCVPSSFMRRRWATPISPAEWETRAICEIMNTGISRGDIQGWQAHNTAKRYPKYGVQKGWECVTSPETGAENFSEITDAEAKQLGFPF